MYNNNQQEMILGYRGSILSHGSLAVALGTTGSLSIVYAQHMSGMQMYPLLSSDYATAVCIFVHHMWIGSFLLMGSASHTGIAMVRENASTSTVCSQNSYQTIASHRDIITGHLVWVTILLGMHRYGVYCHNDTMLSLSRLEDRFSDNSIVLRPILSSLTWEMHGELESLSLRVSDGRICYAWHELGRADFMIHHIHAFTIHVTVLIIVKGIMYSRSSKMVSDKQSLEYRYPCDGPGRGGTCQISPWDHTYVGMFWMYNTIAVVIFHFYWKMQSDVWGIYTIRDAIPVHITGGDFSYTSTAINAWLTQFLWAEAGQVIQSYGTSISGYGLVFCAGHFVWALSLMFLYSGRGYWNELIESIIWAHNKIKLMVSIQGMALSITHGRTAGITHYMFGGVSVTWSYFIARIVSLA